MNKTKRLGRGLEALIKTTQNERETPTQTEDSSTPLPLEEVPIHAIQSNPYQPRDQFEEESLQELAESIRQYGLIQPITVRRISPNQYQLIAGERRLRACMLAGLAKVPAYIREAKDDDLLVMALIENIQRSDLNPIELALAYQRLTHEGNLTIEMVAQKVGKKRSTVNNYLRLLKLPPEIQKGLIEGLIQMGHARALLSIEDPILQIHLYRETIEKQLSVREVEKQAAKLQKQNKSAENPPSSSPLPENLKAQLQNLEKELEIRYNTRVKIHYHTDGKGSIQIHFYTKEDLDRLLELLRQ